MIRFPTAHTQSNKYRFAPGVLCPISLWQQVILQEICSVFFSSFSFPFPLRAPSLQQTKETCGEERRPDLRHTWGRIQRTHGTGEGGQGAIPALHARCNQWVARTTDKTPAHLNKGDIWPCMPAPVLDYDLQSTSAALQQGAGSYGYE